MKNSTLLSWRLAFLKPNFSRKAGEAVAEQAGQQRRPHHRVILALVEDVDQQRHGVPAAGEGRADHHVVDYPDSPGITVADVGDRPKTEQETNRQND
jgi:hypothetical protein